MTSRRHIVQQGDSPQRIEKQYKVSWASIQEHPANAFVRTRKNYPIHPGDVLAIPNVPKAGSLQADVFQNLEVNYLEMVVRRLRGEYRPIPFTSLTSNVLVSSRLDLVDCTMSFRPWPIPGGERTHKLAAIVDVVRRPKPRARILRRQLLTSRCESGCHTPCEKYLHIIAALLRPWPAP